MSKTEFSISPDTRDSYPAEWADWVLHCLERLYKAEIPAEEIFISDADDWVYELLHDQVKTLMPTVSFSAKQSGPEFLGSTIGHQERLFNGSDVERAMEISANALSNSIENSAEQNHYAPDTQESNATIESVNKLFGVIEEVIDQKTVIFLDCIKLAAAQPHDDKVGFFKGYWRALDMQLYNEDGQIIRTKMLTDVTTAMVMFWRQIDEMNNLPEVYEWAKLLFPNKAMNWDQFRKMCNRKGLKKAPPGRPAK